MVALRFNDVVIVCKARKLLPPHTGIAPDYCADTSATNLHKLYRLFRVQQPGLMNQSAGQMSPEDSSSKTQHKLFPESG